MTPSMHTNSEIPHPSLPSLLTALSFALAFSARISAAERTSYVSNGPLLIVGSINVDTTVHLDRLPVRSETKVALRPSPTLAVGGKGANQAVAAALLSKGTGRPVARFVCRLGDDAHLPWLQAELLKAGVDTSASRVVANTTTGAGIVWLDGEGAATSVVLGGANTQGWSLLRPNSESAAGAPPAQQARDGTELEAEEAALLALHAAEVVAGGDGSSTYGSISTACSGSSRGDGDSSSSCGGKGGGEDGDTRRAALKASVMLLQREVPEHVNEAFAAAAVAAGIPVLLDAGGENAPVSPRLLALVDLLAPNEQELQRLSGGMPTDSEAQVAAAAGALMAAGARNVLVTLEGRGSLLLLGQVEGAAEDGHRRCRPVRALRQPALPVPGGVVVDATAAGDAFRAALAVALVEGRGQGEGGGEEGGGGGAAHGRSAHVHNVHYEEALRFAAAAGALAVSRMGAMPSLPTRQEVEELLARHGASPAAQAWDSTELLAAAAEAASVAAPVSTPPTKGTTPPHGAINSNSASSSGGGSGGHVGGGGGGDSLRGACANPDGAASDDTASEAAAAAAAAAADEAADLACPQWLFGARLNSMKARRDLLRRDPLDSASESTSEVAPGAGLDLGAGRRSGGPSAGPEGDGPLGWVARQGLVAAATGGSGGCGAEPGLSVVYFNYPEHLEGLQLQQVLDALSAAGLRPGGVAMRFPAAPFRAGALTNPNATLRAAAVQLGVEGCRWAARLAAAAGSAGGAGGAAGGYSGGHLVVWSAYDGYDYHLQVDYAAAWAAAAEGYGRLAESCGEMGVAVSLEPKPTDPSSRFSFLPNTAAALAFVKAIDRPNLGLTLDTGHMIMAGECLAQGVAEVAAAGRLFGLHLNDGHSRLGAEDGLVFGSVHVAAALELVYFLRYKLPAQPAGPLSWSGGRPGSLPHAFFDTFPLNEDPVAEAAANLASFGALWARAGRLRRAGMEACLADHDALCSLRLIAAVP